MGIGDGERSGVAFSEPERRWQEPDAHKIHLSDLRAECLGKTRRGCGLPFVFSRSGRAGGSLSGGIAESEGV